MMAEDREGIFQEFETGAVIKQLQCKYWVYQNICSGVSVRWKRKPRKNILANLIHKRERHHESAVIEIFPLQY